MKSDPLLDFVEDAIADMLRPVVLCQCIDPLVKEPDERYWCECHRCGKSVAYSTVVDGLATIAGRVH